MASTNRYFWCIAPQCSNTGVRTPGKAFIQVPTDRERRKRWFAAVGRDPCNISLKTVIYLCEDHFDLENDMENYWKWKLTGGPKLMKKNALPRPFNYKPEPIDSEEAKRKRLQLVEEAIADAELASARAEQEAEPEELPTEVPVPEEQHTVKISTRDYGVTARPYFRSKATQMPNVRTFTRACSPIDFDKEKRIRKKATKRRRTDVIKYFLPPSLTADNGVQTDSS